MLPDQNWDDMLRLHAPIIRIAACDCLTAFGDLNDNKIATIPPRSGRLFVFLSEQFPHEVLPTNAERFSIAGWFRINGVRDNLLDIAR